MEEKEMVWIASVAIRKHMSFEKLKYSDYMYGKENLANDVWKYVEECIKIGTDAFCEKYKDYTLFIPEFD